MAYPYPAYANGGAGPVRYMVPPAGYRQPYPPFVNRSFDRFAVVPTTYRAPAVRPVNYPPMYGPGYNQGAAPAPAPAQPQPAPRQHAPTVTAPKSSGDSQKQQHFFNPNGTKKKNSVASIPESKTSLSKKGAKEFKDTAFTIEPDGTQNNAIRGLVSNDDINNLLKHKGTKVKVSKIYRITKTKPEELSESEEEAPPPPPPKTQRPRSASTDSYCSQCDERPCSQCMAQRPPHPYDDCPLCRAQQQQVHVYDDCPECRAERNRQLSTRK